jgi:hypothetical protein
MKSDMDLRGLEKKTDDAAFQVQGLKNAKPFSGLSRGSKIPAGPLNPMRCKSG